MTKNRHYTFKHIAIRKLCRIQTLFAGLTIFFTVSLQAKEGFYATTQSLPVKVAKAWDSVFVVLRDTKTKISSGTAFLIHSRVKANNRELFFLTNRHTIFDCAVKDICQDILLAQNFKANTNKYLQNSDRKDLADLKFDQVMLIAKSENPDLALLKVTALDIPQNNITPLEFAADGELAPMQKLFTIGFSDLDVRISLRKDGPRGLTKRWSEGIFVDFYKVTDKPGLNGVFTGSTVDSINGGSGGPLLNENGEVVAVVKANAINNTSSYDGSEDPKKLDWQTLSVEYSHVMKFLDEIPEE